ncbi:nitroreductase family protein [Thermogemmatispora tikiterensis]|uniref:nitroreductase family protein n=1 Tax=Thermogemmatispora tikiterensis TaxID=1825093 RepID=UPI001CB94AFF|nr:nitroreductase family protein [Thermogemmatispora tikiterensis]
MTTACERAVTVSQRAGDLLTLLRSRRSVRALQERPVPEALLEQVLEAARWAPSPHGRQPWRFVVFSGRERKERLIERMSAAWEAQLRLDQQPEEVIAVRLEKSRQRIRQAPVLILPCLYLEDLDRYPDAERQESERIMAIQSLGAAVQNMLLMAYELGLDTGWMCAPLFCPAAVCEALDLDRRLQPQALITLGYAAADPKRRPRLPLETLVIRLDSQSDGEQPGQ